MMRAEVMPEVLQDGAQEDKGENARLQYFVGAIAVGDLVKSTLGPKGLDKILQPMQALEGSRHEKTTITNDGATILKAVWLDNPAAKILADVALQQDRACGDGTTGVVVIAAELLRQAELLVNQCIHPQIIIHGYRKALAAARTALASVAFGVDSEEDLRKYLTHVATTTLSSKLLTHDKEMFAKIAVDAVFRIKDSPASLDLIHVLKKPGGSLKDSYLDEGFILEKTIGVGQPKLKENCKIMVANTPMDTDKIKIFGARVKVDSFEAVQQLELAEKEKMKEKVEKIAKYEPDVFINRQLIYNYPEQLLAEKNIICIEHSDFDGMERLAGALGASIVSTFDCPSEEQLGFCARLEEILIGEDKAIKFSGCRRGAACTIVLRGSNDHGLDEAERSLHDALAILSLLLQKLQQAKDCDNPLINKDKSAEVVGRKLLVCGAGAAEMQMAAAVDSLARGIPGKESLAVESFARALRKIPTIILDNGGMDSAEIVSSLRALHEDSSNKFVGVDVCAKEMGGTLCAKTAGILEAYHSKLSQICFAAEAAEMIIRVDDIIKCAPRERSGM